MVPYTTIELIGASLFLIAIIHTFSTKYFEHLAHVHKRFSGILHLLGEVEVVFGFWAMVLVLFIFGIEGGDTAVNYVDTRNFTEPMFVFVIMVIAATRPILELSKKNCFTFIKPYSFKKRICHLFSSTKLCSSIRFIYYRACCHDVSCTFIEPKLFWK